MKELSKFSEIIDHYDSYIIDLWGVIHDGQNLYPGVKQTMDELKERGKKCVFLSNAPRRSSKVKAVLGKFGITEDYYIDALSSGEVGFRIINASAAKKYFYIGPQKDRDLMEGSKLEEVAKAADADIAICTGFDEDNSTLDEKMPQIKEVLAAGLKMYCVNPDLIVVRQDGTKMLCAGVIGNYYKEQGGNVEFIGKPHAKVYEYVTNIFNKGQTELSSPVCYSDIGKRILAIGDGPETDIKGANNAGIDSLLVLGGILKAEKRPLAEVLHEIDASPTFTAPNFGW